MVVVANSRQYGFRFDPAPIASMSDGLLDVVYFPVRSRLSFAATAFRTRLRRHLGGTGVIHRTGRAVRIECDPAQRYQIDGDAALHAQCESGERPRDACLTPLTISLRPAALRVLAP
jgi:diacylglycerol kinase family enzyme